MENISEMLFDEGQGILRLKPTWVPRSFCRPGQRMKLHPNDLYKLGLERGGIDERWFNSTTHAENGPGTPEDEGYSYAVSKNGRERILLKKIIDDLKQDIIGNTLWEKYHGWPVYSKYFDNLGPLPHHIHHDDAAAARVGQKGKPEMYFFPVQLNNHGGEFPYTFFGVNEGVTKKDVKNALMKFNDGDNNLLNFSRAYKLMPDTGWDVPPGVLHAPGSLCTYEPQFASDVFAMFQSVLYGQHTVPEALLWKDTPIDKVGDFDYLINIIDWELNIDPAFRQNRFMLPKPVHPTEIMVSEGYLDEWICYKCPIVSAKRFTILPGAKVTIKDSAPYGFVVIQGHGKCGIWDIEAPHLIRYEQLTNDEFFVSENSAKEGVDFYNPSQTDPIVMLKNFAINPDLTL